MIISRTPFRISFFGGGTDYPSWVEEHGGAVLATTIDKYCYISCRHLPPFFEHRIRIVYSKIEDRMRIEDIEHPSVRAVLEHLGVDRGVEIHHDGDLPARSGMGSSSSFTVGLLNAVYALQGTMRNKRELAKKGIYLEQEVMEETVGSQDQVSAAYGGFNHITFLPGGDFTVRPMTLTPERYEELNQHLMLFYTGIKRTASDVASTYCRDTGQSTRVLRIMSEMVKEGVSILYEGEDLIRFGELLREAWEAKRSLSPIISNPEVEEIYGAALEAGAIGGKLTGAGGGGFMLLFVPPEHRTRVRAALPHLIHVPFSFDFSGSQIIFYNPDREYATEDESRPSTLQSFHELASQEVLE